MVKCVCPSLNNCVADCIALVFECILFGDHSTSSALIALLINRFFCELCFVLFGIVLHSVQFFHCPDENSSGAISSHSLFFRFRVYVSRFLQLIFLVLASK